jgi:hypothetical protein
MKLLNVGILLAVGISVPSASAGELELLHDGKSDYQIVVPDESSNAAIAECLQQTARLVQTAFQANGVDLQIVSESRRDAAKPAIFLGDTAFARRQGVQTAKLEGWSYVQRVVGRDLLIAGHDHGAKAATENPRRPNWDRIGTAKGVVDFLREYAGVRFLYPDIPAYNPVSAAAKIDWRHSPAVEFLPRKTIAVPDDLNVHKTPVVRVNTGYPAGGGFYDLAHNRFPRVDEAFGGHTWERAISVDKYFETHPEYFALISGSRQKGDRGRAQYCLSNPEVQELIYQDCASQLDRGYDSTDVGQPDGFRPCQCEQCAKLFDTGKDWGEKIWIFNRNIAERLLRSHPGRQLTMMSYIQTAAPPKTYKTFPTNTCVMLTGTNEADFAPWHGYEVPRGFTGYVYNWCPNLGSRYTPMRTPGYVESQVKRLTANRIQSLNRDGPGQLFGLEGPVYYVMGRMFDDPERNAAKDLVPEFCEAAFGPTAPAMRSFYDQLFHAITLYSDHIGTRCDAWTYYGIDGARRKTVNDPFQLLAFLYPPNLLAALDADLTQAEKAATTAKVKTRLALVRTEFEYLRHLMRVVHLNHAYQIQPDVASRDHLLNAIDARNAFIDTLFEKRPSATNAANWAYVLFPFQGHRVDHLRLAHDGYQEPFANTCLNWDTKAMRSAPLPAKKRLTVAAARSPVAFDDAQWHEAVEHELTQVSPLHKLPRKTTLRLLYDAANLYLRAECELEPDGPASFPTLPHDRTLDKQESIDVYLAPQAGRDTAYRFICGANAATKYDAVAGYITDAMDPRHGKDDPTWNGDWKAETRLDSTAKRWQAFITIPFATLGATKPTARTTWRGNFGRTHLLPRDQVDRAIWSSTVGGSRMDDCSLFGEIVFE